MSLCASWLRCGCAVLSLSALAGIFPPPARAAELPPYMDVIVAGSRPGPTDTARQNVLALNTAMFGLYGDSGKIFSKNILAQHPVILALFTGAGGRLILYRPGRSPIEAPSVPGRFVPRQSSRISV